MYHFQISKVFRRNVLVSQSLYCWGFFSVINLGPLCVEVFLIFNCLRQKWKNSQSFKWEIQKLYV